MSGMRLNEPIKITLSITNTCNQNCALCYSDCGRETAEAELWREEWLTFIDYLVENDFMQVYIEGGEPLLRPDMMDILRHCSRRLMTLIRTNGSLISRDIAFELKSIGVGRVLVDVMSSQADVHDDFAGVVGSFAKACKAIEFLAEAKIPTDVLTILTRQNASNLSNIAELAFRLGADRMGVLRLYPIGRAKRRWKQFALTLPEQMKAIKELKAPDGLSIMQSWHPRNHNCCWQSATVDAVGNSIGCVYLREYVNYGNIRKMDFLETWRHDPLYKQLRSGHVEHSCSDCEKTQGSSGGCRSTAFAFHGRWDAPDPFCSTMNDGVDLRDVPQ
jgi:radical SAM protein with 4Fe4S-binding SPASM domain